MRKVNLLKWRFYNKFTREYISEHYVIDRGDNKRKTAKALYQILEELSGIKFDKSYMRIGGFEEFKDYALTYNCKK